MVQGILLVVYINEKLITTNSTNATSGFWREVDNAQIKHLTLRGEEHINYSHKYSNNGWAGFRIGGMAGTIANSKINDCICDINIFCKTVRSDGIEASYIGGVVGKFIGERNSVCYCINKGSLYSESFHYTCPDRLFIGGISGGTYKNDTISYCENITKAYYRKGFVFAGDFYYSLYFGGIVGELRSSAKILFCKNIIDYIGLENTLEGLKPSSSIDTSHFCVGGIVGKLRTSLSDYKSSIINCFSSIKSIETLNTVNAKLSVFYGGIGSCSDISSLKDSEEKANYSNNDVRILSDKKIDRVYDGSTAFSSVEMQASVFLEELNMYSILEMDGPVWKQDKGGGYPYIAKLYEQEGVGVNPVLQDKAKDNHYYYSLTGQRLNTPQKGLNIIGGKKVIVR